MLTAEEKETLENLKENLKKIGDEFEIPFENENIKLIENAFVTGRLGSVVTVKIELEVPGLAKDYEHENVKTRVVEIVLQKEIVLEVEATENQKIIIVNVENEILPPGLISRVLVDNEPIEMADDFEDILDPTDENEPEYLIVKGGRGAQIIISIPYFSTHVLTITTLPTQPFVGVSAYVFVLGAIILVVLFIIIIWKYLAMGRRKLGTVSKEKPSLPSLPRP